MKTIKKIVYILTGLALLFSSCTKDFEKINTDPNTSPYALPEQLLAPALVNTMNANMLRNRNFNNELMQVTVDISDGEGRIFRYDIRSNVADNLWNAWYTQLTNFKDIYKFASEEAAFNESYMGISLICQSWLYSMLTDTYGEVPYFESNKARDEKIYEPAFDTQQDIYTDMFAKLEEANTLLSKGTRILGSSDPVFNGDVAKWRKFGNSLYLRLLLRVSGKAELAENSIAKIKEMVETSASSYPKMTSNADAAILRWTGVAPYTSPLMSVREQDFRAVSMGKFFIDNLVNWNDPRIDIPTYGSEGINRWAIAPYQGAFLGVPSGYAQGEGLARLSYFYSTSSARTLMNDPLTGQIMNFAELQFILAEAAAKGWISGSAENYYNAGVQNSITLWVPTWDVPVTDYLNAADIPWDDQLSLDEKMEKIHLQKYYSLFLTDLQQWFEYRRTGHPVLPKGPGLKNNGIMPARLNYPIYVQSTNPTNYKTAVARQGTDAISTEVWWQKQ